MALMAKEPEPDEVKLFFRAVYWLMLVRKPWACEKVLVEPINTLVRSPEPPLARQLLIMSPMVPSKLTLVILRLLIQVVMLVWLRTTGRVVQIVPTTKLTKNITMDTIERIIASRATTHRQTLTPHRQRFLCSLSEKPIRNNPDSIRAIRNPPREAVTNKLTGMYWLVPLKMGERVDEKFENWSVVLEIRLEIDRRVD